MLDRRVRRRTGAACCQRRRARRPGRRLRRAPRRWPRTPGSRFVDVKHCHGYLGHELLGARERPGPLRRQPREPHALPARDRRRHSRATAPGLAIGVRLSAFDMVPFRKGADGVGEPEADAGDYTHGFGLIDDRRRSRRARRSPRVAARCSRIAACAGSASPPAARTTTRTSQRPALFPPSDGYQPPEDPLLGVARQIDATAAAEGRASRAWRIVGTGYTLPAGVAAARRRRREVREGRTDFVGLGRMVLCVSRAAGRRACAARRSSASASAARSATARRGRATASCRAASRSIRSTSIIRTARG